MRRTDDPRTNGYGTISIMTYQVEIVETLSRSVKVRAESAEDAERIVRDRYLAGDIVLGGDDCVECELKVADDA